MPQWWYPEPEEPTHEVTLNGAAGHSLAIIVPAYKRIELSAICFRQMADACKSMRRDFGLDARVVVIADDENLDMAMNAGHITIEHPNPLGTRLNRGYSFAAAQGFEYVCPLGSDSWLYPDHYRLLPDQDSMLCTRNYVCISPDGERQGWFVIGYDGGVGNRVFHLSMLSGCNYRPLRETRPNGCDTATLASITATRGKPLFVYTNPHPFEVVGFQSDVQITAFERYVANWLNEWQEPFSGLIDHYPVRFVREVKAYYGSLKERN